MIEVEKRAKLTKEQFELVREQILKRGTLIKKINRKTLVYVWRDDWQPFPQSAAAPFDLKIRTDELKSGIAVKREIKNMHSRWEFELEFGAEGFGKHLELLVALGFSRYVMTKLHRDVYRVEKFKVSLDYHKTIDTYMIEVELTTEKEAATARLEKQIDGFFTKLGLKVLNNEETVKILCKLNNVEKYRLDFEKIGLETWLRQFHYDG